VYILYIIILVEKKIHRYLINYVLYNNIHRNNNDTAFMIMKYTKWNCTVALEVKNRMGLQLLCTWNTTCCSARSKLTAFVFKLYIRLPQPHDFVVCTHYNNSLRIRRFWIFFENSKNIIWLTLTCCYILHF